ncbi:MAG: helix-turn-helix domain-containing protein [Candidatus Lokiarchaeota archaeon]|nr:helix-turn-helix domain-containing protein [Candidatus Lokiarchaeota archaeon]
MEENKPSLAWIEIETPKQKWISEIFKKYRDVEIVILNFLPYDFETFIANAIIEIYHYKIEEIIDDIKTHPSVLEFSVLEKLENRVKINIKTEDPYLLYAIIKNGVLIDFPVRISEGLAIWKLVATRKRINDLLLQFEERGINFSLLRILNSDYSIDDNENKLNQEESQVINKAIKLGFFDIPRRISLEELANELGKSKSALSVRLRKIIKKKVLFES